MTLVVQGLCKNYGSSSVFRNVSLTVANGEFVAIIGESGVGKSTLLNCMAGLDHWDAGSVTLDGADIAAMNDTQRATRSVSCSRRFMYCRTWTWHKISGCR